MGIPYVPFIWWYPSNQVPIDQTVQVFQGPPVLVVIMLLVLGIGIAIAILLLRKIIKQLGRVDI